MVDSYENNESREKNNLTCSSISVRVNPKRVQSSDHLQICFGEFSFTVLGPFLKCRSIVPGLLNQFGHFMVCSILVISEEMNPSEPLVSSGMPDFEGVDVAISSQL